MTKPTPLQLHEQLSKLADSVIPDVRSRHAMFRLAEHDFSDLEQKLLSNTNLKEGVDIYQEEAKRLGITRREAKAIMQYRMHGGGGRG